MTYTLSYSNQAVKSIKNAEKELQQRILKKAEELQTKPFPKDAKSITGYMEKMFRVRVGDLRIIYEVDETAKLIGVIKIDKRSRVYKRHD